MVVCCLSLLFEDKGVSPLVASLWMRSVGTQCASETSTVEKSCGCWSVGKE